jgi:hypothetical protein
LLRRFLIEVYLLLYLHTVLASLVKLALFPPEII